MICGLPEGKQKREEVITKAAASESNWTIERNQKSGLAHVKDRAFTQCIIGPQIFEPHLQACTSASYGLIRRRYRAADRYLYVCKC